MIIKNIYKLVRRFLGKIARRFFGSIMFCNRSYSQYGEDRVLVALLHSEGITLKDDIFYVDIGAYHPFEYSNTYLFYQAGAKGINIDCRPGSMKFFNQTRKRDINLEVALSDKVKELIYYMYDNCPACNTFDKALVDTRPFKPSKEILIKTCRINDIFEKYVSEGEKITFLDIDVENQEYNILNNFDFKKYCPKYILCEMLDDSQDKKDLAKLLKENSYFEVSRCVILQEFLNILSKIFNESQYMYNLL